MHSSPNVPSTNPGARKAAIGGVLTFAPYSTVSTFSHAYSIFIGLAVPGIQPSQPSEQTYSPRIAVSVPSARAATLRR